MSGQKGNEREYLNLHIRLRPHRKQEEVRSNFLYDRCQTKQESGEISSLPIWQFSDRTGYKAKLLTFYLTDIRQSKSWGENSQLPFWQMLDRTENEGKSFNYLFNKYQTKQVNEVESPNFLVDRCQTEHEVRWNLPMSYLTETDKRKWEKVGRFALQLLNWHSDIRQSSEGNSPNFLFDR